ncbi:MAG: Zn-dependent hydrolase [Thermomicrobiales bacterium]
MFSILTRINADRLWASISQSAAIGTKGAGLGRLALGDSDKKMRDLFSQWCRDEGLTISIDNAGNIFARRDGLDNALPAVMLGSHLDTQEEGGRFDGVLGVLGALEVIRTLNEKGHVTRRPLNIVSWTNEEGARFSPPMLGSGCFIGVHDIEWAHAIVSNDAEEATLGAELERIGYLGRDVIGSDSIDSYFELHIEQGALLDAERRQIGVVSNAATVHGFKFQFTGETAHAGTLPMKKRKNALVASARLATAIDDIGLEHAAKGAMATTARISATPNKPGILSNFSELVGDIRHSDPASAAAMMRQVEAAATAAGEQSQCTHELVERWHWGGSIFDLQLISSVRSTAERCGYSHMDIASQAGHDAYFLSRVCPTAMIFVPCVGGVTHHPDELITRDGSAAGANVLLHTVVARADR